jgi:hypothetical protein
MKGEYEKYYELSISVNGKTYISRTKIPAPVKLDTVWYKVQEQDTLGFAWAHLTDPDTLGNAYRWFAKRINLNSKGVPKDNYYVAPFGSVFDDKFINAKSFDFAYDRGHPPSQEGVASEPGEVQHYFKPWDTIAIKFCTIDYGVFQFLRLYESVIFNNGNPFASPASVPSNISGGALGVWAGYGISNDTIFGKK